MSEEVLLDKKVVELTNLLKRTQAEFENYSKRVERDSELSVKRALREFIVSLLPVLDSFELAIKNKSKDRDFLRGVEGIYAQFFGVLNANGLKVIECVGKEFDVKLHEAVMSVGSGKFVVDELMRGYFVGDVVVRHSKVKVAGGKENE